MCCRNFATSVSFRRWWLLFFSRRLSSLLSLSLGCGERSSSAVWDSRVSPQQQSTGPEPSNHQQIANSFKWMYRMGADIHSGLPGKLHTPRWPRVPEVREEKKKLINVARQWSDVSSKPCLISCSFSSMLTSASICERVTPRLSHANSAVVLSAVKVLMKFMEMLPKDLDYYGTLLKKLAPPLVTLLSAEPELQYVALRNINLIVQRR